MFFYHVHFCKIYQIFYFHPQIFFRTDFGSSRKKSFEYAGNCVWGYTRMWLNMYVRQSSCSWGSVYNGETKKKIVSRSIEHQQESIKGNWSSYGATKHTKKCHGHFDGLHPKTFSMKNSHYDRKKSRNHWKLIWWQSGMDKIKVLNRDNGNFVKTNAWKRLFKK